MGDAAAAGCGDDGGACVSHGSRQFRPGPLADHVRSLPPSGKILSADEQLALLIRWRSDGDAEALVRLVQSVAPMVYGLASEFGWKYARAGADSTDLAQDGFVAVLKAIRRYEIGHPGGLQFPWYVYRGVLMSLKFAIRSLPSRRNRRCGLCPCSLDEDDVLPLPQPEPETGLFEELLGGEWDRLDEALARVDARARAILIRHVGYDGAEPETLRQIAVWAGVSKERVRQLKDRALGKLRIELDAMLRRDEGIRSASGATV